MQSRQQGKAEPSLTPRCDPWYVSTLTPTQDLTLKVPLLQKRWISQQILLPASLFIQYRVLMAFNSPPSLFLAFSAKPSKPAAPSVCHSSSFPPLSPATATTIPQRHQSTNNPASATWTGFNQRICWGFYHVRHLINNFTPLRKGGGKKRCYPSFCTGNKFYFGGEQNNNKIIHKIKSFAGMKGLRDLQECICERGD